MLSLLFYGEFLLILQGLKWPLLCEVFSFSQAELVLHILGSTELLYRPLNDSTNMHVCSDGHTLGAADTEAEQALSLFQRCSTRSD